MSKFLRSRIVVGRVIFGMDKDARGNVLATDYLDGYGVDQLVPRR